MPFFLSNSFDERLAQKSFELLKRWRVPGADDVEFRALLCADSSFMLQELLLCTDQAVFYLPKMTYTFNKYDFSSITAVTIGTAGIYPIVCLTISNSMVVKPLILTKEADKMADYIKSKLVPPAPAFSPADEILKYKGLLDCGAITQEEYDAKKKQLLGL